jgi:hypothetical protein
MFETSGAGSSPLLQDTIIIKAIDIKAIFFIVLLT